MAHQLRLISGEFAAEARAARLVGVDGHCTHLLLEAAFPVDSPVNHQQLLSGLDGPRRPHIRSLCEVRSSGVERDTAVDGPLVLACIDVPGAALDCGDHRATQTVLVADVHSLLVRPQLLVPDDSAVELCNQRTLLDRFPIYKDSRHTAQHRQMECRLSTRPVATPARGLVRWKTDLKSTKSTTLLSTRPLNTSQHISKRHTSTQIE